MNKMNWKWTLVFAAALVAVTVLLNALACAGKPPVTPPPPPPPKPLPPVKYNIKWLNVMGRTSTRGRDKRFRLTSSAQTDATPRAMRRLSCIRRDRVSLT